MIQEKLVSINLLNVLTVKLNNNKLIRLGLKLSTGGKYILKKNIIQTEVKKQLGQNMRLISQTCQIVFYSVKFRYSISYLADILNVSLLNQLTNIGIISLCLVVIIQSNRMIRGISVNKPILKEQFW